MTPWIVIISLLIILLIYLLWMPVIVKIDTDTGEYFIQFKGLAKASILGDEQELIKIKLNVLFMNFDLFPLRKKFSRKKQLKEPEKKKKKWTVVKGQKAFRILRSFKVKKLVLEMDTGDFVLNAKLYSVLFFMNRFNGSYAINFENRNRLALHLENRPIRIIKSIINP